MSHDSLAAALAAFQSELPTVAKGNEAKVPTKNGGEYKYQYADLTDVTAAVLPVLARHGLSFNSKPTMTEHGFVLAYRLLHESGESDKGKYPLPDPGHTQAQQMGSAITYARRYCLCAVTGIAPGGDDDDAQAAQSAPPRQAHPKRPQAPAGWRERILSAGDMPTLSAMYAKANTEGWLTDEVVSTLGARKQELQAVSADPATGEVTADGYEAAESARFDAAVTDGEVHP